VSAKPTGLAAFVKGKAPSPSAPPAEMATDVAETAETPLPKAGRRRAQGDLVSLTVRIPRGEWLRLHQLAAAEGVSIQSLAVDGFSEIFAKHGLPPITG